MRKKLLLMTMLAAAIMASLPAGATRYLYDGWMEFEYVDRNTDQEWQLSNRYRSRDVVIFGALQGATPAIDQGFDLTWETLIYNPEARVKKNNNGSWEECSFSEFDNKSINRMVILDEAFSGVGKFGQLNIRTNTSASGDVIIGDEAFAGSSVTDVNIAGTSVTIGNSAFAGCEQLVTFISGASTQATVGTEAFANCPSLREATVSYVSNVPNRCFLNDANLTMVAIEGASIATIGNQAFYGTPLLTNLRGAFSQMTSIGAQAFYGSGILDVQATNVTSVGAEAFANCANLASVQLGAINTIPQGLCLNDAKLELFSFTDNGQEMTLSEQAFMGCAKLESLGVGTITAFPADFCNGCSKLYGIEFNGADNYVSVGARAFKDCTALQSNFGFDVYKLSTIGEDAFNGCAGIETFIFNEGLTTIGKGAFLGANRMWSITCEGATPPAFDAAVTAAADVFPATVIEMVTPEVAEENLAAYQSAPVWAEFWTGKKQVGYEFEYDGLWYRLNTAERYPENNYTDYRATLIPHPDTQYTMPEHEYAGAISGYTGESYSVPDVIDLDWGQVTVNTIGRQAFQGCHSLKVIDLPMSIDSIGDGAFRDSGLMSFKFPEESCATGRNILSNCPDLCSVDMTGSYVDSLFYAFEQCPKLSYVKLDGGAMTSLVGTFERCTSLLAVDLSGVPDLSVINGNAFRECSSMRAIDFPDGVSDISMYALYDMPALETIRFHSATPPYLSELAFGGTTSNVKVIVPADAVATYKQAEGFSHSAIAGIYSEEDYDHFSDLDMCAKFQGTSGAWYRVESFGEDGNAGSALLSTPRRGGDPASGNITASGTTAYNCLDFDVTGIDYGPIFKNSLVNSIDLSAMGGMEMMPDSLFYGCEQLTNVVLPEYTWGIGASMFENCTSLTSLNFLTTVGIIGKRAFAGCTGLTELRIDTTLWVDIQEEAFYGCANLERVFLGHSSPIANGAFLDCPAISYVSTRNYDPGELDNRSFTENVFSTATLVVPLGTEEKYAAANGWKKFAHLKSSTLISGDANSDAAVDGSDVSIMLEMTLAGAGTDAVFDTTDINEDGNIDGSDISILLEKVLAGGN